MTTDDIFLDIASRTVFLSERLEKKKLLETLCKRRMSPREKETVEKRFAYWMKVVADGDKKYFQKRLSWDRLKIADARNALRDVSFPASGAFQPWTETLRSLLNSKPDQKTHFDTREKVIAFQEILEHVLPMARRKLLPSKLLSQRALRDFELCLLRTLLEIASSTLSFELMGRQTGIKSFRKFEKLTRVPNITCYQEFAEDFKRNGFGPLFKKYPVLGRLFASSIDLWALNVNEFLERFALDSSLVERLFSIQNPFITGIQGELSDSHNGGKGVFILTLNSGIKLVYKPKPLGLEKIYNRFLEWCNQSGMPFKLKVFKVLDRGKYGWTEYIKHAPCKNKKDVGKFYSRMGELLCIQYLLSGSDCQGENIIADGSYPVIIDMETLISARYPFGPFKNYSPYFESVIPASILPGWTCLDRTNKLFDQAGVQFHTLAWQRKNYRQAKNVKFITRNVPLLRREKIGINDFVVDFVKGFSGAYTFFLQTKKMLLKKGGPLEGFHSQPARFLHRYTRTYYRMLQKSLFPEFLRDGVVWSMELERLWHKTTEFTFDKLEVPLVRAELKSMEQLDVPYFFRSTSGRNICISADKFVRNAFKKSGYQDMRKRVRKLDNQDSKQQVAIIQGSFSARQKKSRQRPATQCCFYKPF